MDVKIIGAAAVAVAIVGGVLVYTNSGDEQVVVQETTQMPQEKVVRKSVIETAPEVVKVEVKKELELKEEVVKVQEIVQKVEPKLSGFKKAVVQELSEAKLSTSSYSKLYDQNELNIFIDDSLKDKMKKRRIDNTAMLILKNIKTATAVIKEDDNGEVYLEISKYKENINPDSFDTLTKLNDGNKLLKSKHTYHFGFDAAKVNADENVGTFLGDLDAAMKEVDVKNITVVGYTDSKGSKDYNIFLSYKRAHALNKDLEKYNLDINYILRGESNPIASNKTKESRAQNRRVEIFLGYK